MKIFYNESKDDFKIFRDILAYHQVYFGHQGRTHNVDIKMKM